MKSPMWMPVNQKMGFMSYKAVDRNVSHVRKAGTCDESRRQRAMRDSSFLVTINFRHSTYPQQTQYYR
jgi:hypothetical protein